MSSVSLRKFSIIGESPRMIGMSFAAACAHEDASVAEHAAVFADDCSLLSSSVCAGVSCARIGVARSRHARETSHKQTGKIARIEILAHHCVPTHKRHAL